MRLSDITINYSDLSNLSVTFSDVYKIGSPTINKVSEILSKAQSMSSSYSTTIKQAEQGEKANNTFSKIQEEGLNSALYNIRNSNSTTVFDEHGILIRSYDDILDDYTDEQLRETHNEIVFTTDKWKSAITAIGKQRYTLNGITYEEYGVNSQFVIAGKIISGDIYSGNYTTDSSGVCTSGTHINLTDGTFVMGGGKLKYENDELSINGVITATTGKIGGYIINEHTLIGESVGISSKSGYGWAFWAGSDNPNEAIYRVGHNGQVISNSFYSNNVTITGGTINLSSTQQDTLISLSYYTDKNTIVTNTIKAGEVRITNEDGTFTAMQGHMLFGGDLNNSYIYRITSKGYIEAKVIEANNIKADNFYIKNGSNYSDLMSYIRNSEKAGTMRVSGSDCYIEGYYYIRSGDGGWMELSDWIKNKLGL